MAAGVGATRRVGTLFGDRLENLEQDLICRHAFRFGFEVQDHAMPHGGQEHAPHIFEADIVASVQQGADLGGQGHGLAPRGLLPQRKYLFVAGAANSPAG